MAPQTLESNVFKSFANNVSDLRVFLWISLPHFFNGGIVVSRACPIETLKGHN
jgi:hypothetical protein